MTGIKCTVTVILGVFMPIVSAPIVGNINYFMNGKGDGVVILILAAAAAILTFTGRVRHVVWPGAAALLMLGFTFIRFQYGMAEMRRRMETELAGNPFRGLADMATNSIQLQWGWAVLVLGAGLLIYAGITARRQISSPEDSTPAQ